MIKIKIDVTKLDKKLFFNAASGAIYCDIVAIETPNSKFSDFMIVQDLPKERREAGEKGTIVGNASRIMPRNQPNDQQDSGDVSASDAASTDNDQKSFVVAEKDLPF